MSEGRGRLRRDWSLLRQASSFPGHNYSIEMQWFSSITSALCLPNPPNYYELLYCANKTQSGKCCMMKCAYNAPAPRSDMCLSVKHSSENASVPVIHILENRFRSKVSRTRDCALVTERCRIWVTDKLKFAFISHVTWKDACILINNEAIQRANLPAESLLSGEFGFHTRVPWRSTRCFLLVALCAWKFARDTPFPGWVCCKLVRKGSF